VSSSKNTITTHLSFSPVARGVLQFLAEIEGSSATALVTRLLREELARLLPGAWAEASALQGETQIIDASPLARATTTALALRVKHRIALDTSQRKR
jgi:hypothetical protein